MSKPKETKWVRLGDYIKQSDQRAGDKLSVDDVAGISTEKILFQLS